jgi:hypothetical protein
MINGRLTPKKDWRELPWPFPLLATLSNNSIHMACRPCQLYALNSWHLKVMGFNHLTYGLIECMEKVEGKGPIQLCQIPT